MCHLLSKMSCWQLSRFGKIIAPIKKIAIGSKLESVKHVVSFRRFTYMILNGKSMWSWLKFKFKVDDFDYTVFVSTNTMKCFFCGKSGHLIRGCPEMSLIKVSRITVLKIRMLRTKMEKLLLLLMTLILVIRKKFVLADNNVDSGLIRQSDESDEICTKKSDLIIFEMDESNNTDGGEEAVWIHKRAWVNFLIPNRIWRMWSDMIC